MDIATLESPAKDHVTTTLLHGRGTQLQQPEFGLVLPDSPNRNQTEQFVASRFHEAYGASIIEFFPLLLCRKDAGNISSVLGLRTGTQRPLFLEQYLDRDLESEIFRLTGSQVGREQLVEIGNLSSAGRFGSQLLFILLTAILAEAEFEWVVFTATRQIRQLLCRLQFVPVTLCAADPGRLLNKQQVWGSYYQSKPEVQAGKIAAGLEILQNNPVTAALLDQYSQEIKALASALSQYRDQQDA